MNFKKKKEKKEKREKRVYVLIFVTTFSITGYWRLTYQHNIIGACCMKCLIRSNRTQVSRLVPSFLNIAIPFKSIKEIKISLSCFFFVIKAVAWSYYTRDPHLSQPTSLTKYAQW